jgi:hypothetical protein
MAGQPFPSRFREQPIADAASAHSAHIHEDVTDAASAGVTDRKGSCLASIPSTAVQLKQLLAGHCRTTERTHHVGVLKTSLDRMNVSFLGWPKADEAVAKGWIRNRERDDDAN